MLPWSIHHYSLEYITLNRNVCFSDHYHNTEFEQMTVPIKIQATVDGCMDL